MNKAAGLTAIKQEELKACAVSGPEKRGPKKVSVHKHALLFIPKSLEYWLFSIFALSHPNVIEFNLTQVDREAEAAERKKKLRELRTQKSTESQASASTVDEAVA